MAFYEFLILKYLQNPLRKTFFTPAKAGARFLGFLEFRHTSE